MAKGPFSTPERLRYCSSAAWAACGIVVGLPLRVPARQHRGEAGAVRGGQSEQRGGESIHGAGIRGFGLAGATAGAPADGLGVTPCSDKGFGCVGF